jgi:hypothetical protein
MIVWAFFKNVVKIGIVNGRKIDIVYRWKIDIVYRWKIDIVYGIKIVDAKGLIKIVDTGKLWLYKNEVPCSEYKNVFQKGVAVDI